MNNYPNNQQSLALHIRHMQKTIHLCCELLPLLPQIKNMANLTTLFQQFTK